MSAGIYELRINSDIPVWFSIEHLYRVPRLTCDVCERKKDYWWVYHPSFPVPTLSPSSRKLLRSDTTIHGPRDPFNHLMQEIHSKSSTGQSFLPGASMGPATGRMSGHCVDICEFGPVFLNARTYASLRDLGVSMPSAKKPMIRQVTGNRGIADLLELEVIPAVRLANITSICDSCGQGDFPRKRLVRADSIPESKDIFSCLDDGRIYVTRRFRDATKKLNISYLIFKKANLG